MTAALIPLLLGGILFVEQEIPGLPPAYYYLGVRMPRLHRADLDDDGDADLVLEAQVFLQGDGLFAVDSPLPTPGADRGAACDIWGGTVFLRDEQKLEVLALRNGAWATVHTQEIAWPAPVRSPLDGSAEERRPGVAFERFVHDINGDGVPELVVPAEDGLHVFERAESHYRDAACLDVYPPLRVFQDSDAVLWPPEERRIAWPARATACMFMIQDHRLTVLSTIRPPGGRHRGWQVADYVVDAEDGYRIDPQRASRRVVGVPPPGSRHNLPARLNHDALVDFFVDEQDMVTTSPLPIPIFENQVTTDEGRTYQGVRSVSPIPYWSFVDFDTDGDLDLVTHSSDVFRGGVRETVSRLLTSRDVEHRIAVRLQDGNGRFSQTPDVRGRFKLRLEAPLSQSRRGWWNGALCLPGDFNGDGRCDVAVRNRPRQVAVYLCRGAEFEETPAATIRLPEDSFFIPADLNVDGRSDLLLRVMPTGGGPTPRAIAYLNRGDAP